MSYLKIRILAFLLFVINCFSMAQTIEPPRLVVGIMVDGSHEGLEVDGVYVGPYVVGLLVGIDVVGSHVGLVVVGARVG